MRSEPHPRGKVDAFIDTFGGPYVDLALELGIAPDRIDTIIDFAAAAKHGVKTEGNSAAANAKVLVRTCQPDRHWSPRDPDRQGLSFGRCTRGLSASGAASYPR